MKRQIRDLLPSDTQGVAAIAARIMPYPWSEKLFQCCFSEGYLNWILEVENHVAGYLIAKWVGDESELLSLGVDVPFQRQGHGQYLLKKLVGVLTSHGVQSIWLEVRRSNDVAIALYHRVGFVEVGIRKNYYPTADAREDALIFRYFLHLKKESYKNAKVY
ncbi:MAG: ribosomal-protein-alanine N-acetyltransferase [Coxiella sp. RIFCSPHIGHO2_12_FULL_42_15]|nr:MAG: ribosomal-protein-alanine N-acetyltransferase [Coxiella sp. RIFCSPHIGHO2_12_FULL_42_15]